MLLRKRGSRAAKSSLPLTRPKKIGHDQASHGTEPEANQLFPLDFNPRNVFCFMESSDLGSEI